MIQHKTKANPIINKILLFIIEPLQIKIDPIAIKIKPNIETSNNMLFLFIFKFSYIRVN